MYQSIGTWKQTTTLDIIFAEEVTFLAISCNGLGLFSICVELEILVAWIQLQIQKKRRQMFKIIIRSHFIHCFYIRDTLWAVQHSPMNNLRTVLWLGFATLGPSCPWLRLLHNANLTETATSPFQHCFAHLPKWSFRIGGLVMLVSTFEI